MIALLVDDEKHVRNALRMLIKWEEHGISQIFEAENGEEAIEVIGREKPQIIITDMMMPVRAAWSCSNGCRPTTLPPNQS